MSNSELTIPPTEPPLLTYQSAAIPIAPPGWSGLQTFGYLPERMGAAIQERLMWRGFIIVFSLFVILSVELLVLHPDSHRIPYIFGYIVALVIPILAYRLWRIARVIKTQWPTFRIILSDQGIFRVCKGYSDLIILNSEIKEIREITGTGLTIRGRTALHLIFISSKYIENYPQIRAHLQALRPITLIRRRWLLLTRNTILFLLMAFVPLAIIMVGVFSNDLRIELSSLAAEILVCLFSVFITWRNPNAMQSQKFNTLVLLLLPLFLLVKILLVHGFFR